MRILGGTLPNPEQGGGDLGMVLEGRGSDMEPEF